jgi:O-methyltransferase
MADAIHLYIDLLKKCVSNSIYDDDLDLMRGKAALDRETGKYVVVQPAPPDPNIKHQGGMWPSRAHTMIGIPRLDNIQFCVEQVLRDGIKGDLIETGVWRGGAVIFMRGILEAHGVTDRVVWVADSFQGLPPADLARYPQESPMPFHMYGDLAVSLEQVRDHFNRYGLLDEQVRFLKGWFRDTLPSAPIKELALMRLDGDMYESTMDGLINLYPKLSPGGFVIVDDYNAVEVCNAAVDTFRSQRGITETLSLIPGAGAFWRKETHRLP